MIQGVQIDLISAERLDSMTMMEKIRLILDDVMQGNVVVIERGLAPEEQSKLIEVTMREITPDGFSGIEMETYPSRDGDDRPGFFGRLFGKKSTASRLTVIGPADQMKTIRKEKDLISTWVSSR
jgi:hypothetical protein